MPELGIDPDRVAVGGASAGRHVATRTAMIRGEIGTVEMELCLPVVR